jgi:hypothetical protein
VREAFGILAEIYYDWKEKLENGHYEIKIKRERMRKIDKAKLKQALTDRPDAYLKKLVEQFDCTVIAVFYVLKKFTITRKKRALPIMKTASLSQNPRK